MATPVIADSQAPTTSGSSTMATMCLVAGWLVPGAGHFLLRKPIRGALLFLSVVAMFFIGVGLDGKVYQPNTGNLLDMLGFIGQIGAGVLYALARMLDWGHASVQVALQDYGTKFIEVAGLLNIVAAVDAHSLASGRKAS